MTFKAWAISLYRQGDAFLAKNLHFMIFHSTQRACDDMSQDRRHASNPNIKCNHETTCDHYRDAGGVGSRTANVSLHRLWICKSTSRHLQNPELFTQIFCCIGAGNQPNTFKTTLLLVDQLISIALSHLQMPFNGLLFQ